MGVFTSKNWLKFLGLSWLIVLAVGCGSIEDDKNSYLSGKIINANEKFIRLYQKGQLIDSIPLSENGHFHYKFPKRSQGLFVFRHQPESQLFFIEPGDSLLMRLNTIEFDETMTFTGQGAAKNNFLANQFLENEANNGMVYSYAEKPDRFIKALDSIHEKRMGHLKILKAKNHLSESFLAIAHKLINYEIYGLKERYKFFLDKYLPIKEKKLPKTYLYYRENVDFNDSLMTDFYLYQQFLDSYLKNRSFQYCESMAEHENCQDLTSYGNTFGRLQLSDSIFKLGTLRDRYLRHFGKLAILRSSSQGEIEKVQNFLTHIDCPKQKLAEVNKLVTIQKVLLDGNQLYQMPVIKQNGKETTIGKLINGQPAAIFFWDLYSPKTQKLIHEKAEKLNTSFPKIQFIGININSTKTDMWLKSLKNFNYHSITEVQIKNNPYNLKAFRNFSKQILVIDPQKTNRIQNERIFASSLESKLKKI